ncbi:MAG: PSD1 and planctomycete cytochrome C domain-containing protein [Fuerstiella sp.]
MWRLLIVCGVCLSANSISADQREDFFESKIRPLLIHHCVSCHGPEAQENDLRLDSRSQVIDGNEEVERLVVPGKPEQSRLFQVIQYSEDDSQMPPKGKLSPQQIQDVKTWIQHGASWPKKSEFGKAAAFDPEAWKQHWAFQPVTDPLLPANHQTNWHPIDSFVRRKLNTEGVLPSPTADGRTLTRRLSYDLTGLPPNQDDLDVAASFTNETELHQWLNQYTDQLLTSPSFGERWARYWLDIARYADTKGYVFREDRAYPDAWQFREWVIHSLNDDMPYDQFLKRQIAADQLPDRNDPKQLAAMGFFTLGRRFLNNKHDIIDDRIDVLSRGTLGLTVACARCHDHKFDPIPTADYYSLYGVFDSSEEPKDGKSTLQLVDKAKPRQPFVFIRGQAGNRGETIPRRFLTALGGSDEKPFQNGSGRLELAEQIASKNNPLTARVAVNRIWLRLLGQGLVESASDFGVRTPPPSHPQLLDHLAHHFVANNWSRKQLIRYITRSMTYRQSSQARPQLFDSDPDNRLLARMPKRRLNFEALRDSILSASGQLQQNAVGGTSIDITTVPSTPRRTVYAKIDRQNLPGVFRTFDFASPDSHAATRHETTVPQQALFQFNSPFMMEQAQHAATSLLNPSAEANDVEVQVSNVQALYRRILKRAANETETSQALNFISHVKQSTGTPTQIGWRYGWGEINQRQNKVVVFNEFTEFHDGRFSGGAKLPDPEIGWSSLTAKGGHPGGDHAHCVIRRWIADRSGPLHITGKLTHKSEKGDGVLGLMIHHDQQLQKKVAHNQSIKFDTRTTVQAGDTIDLVTYCQTNESHDSFDWQATIFQFADGQTVRKWSSESDFSPSKITRLQPWAQLAQVLMMTNEFVFID